MQAKAPAFSRAAFISRTGQTQDMGNKGLTNEAYFAAYAPEVPDWFMPDVINNCRDGLIPDDHYDKIEGRWFAWRLYYARKMCELL